MLCYVVLCYLNGDCDCGFAVIKVDVATSILQQHHRLLLKVHAALSKLGLHIDLQVRSWPNANSKVLRDDTVVSNAIQEVDVGAKDELEAVARNTKCGAAW